MKPKTNRNFKVPLDHFASSISAVKFLNNIVVDKGLNRFYECAAEFVHLCPPGDRRQITLVTINGFCLLSKPPFPSP